MTAPVTPLGRFRAFYRLKLWVEIPESPRTGRGALPRLPLYKADVWLRTCLGPMRKRYGLSGTCPWLFLWHLFCVRLPFRCDGAFQIFCQKLLGGPMLGASRPDVLG